MGNGQGLLIVRRDAYYPVPLELVADLLGGELVAPPTDFSGTNPIIKRSWGNGGKGIARPSAACPQQILDYQHFQAGQGWQGNVVG